MISLFMMYVLFWYTSVTKALTRLQQLSYRNDKYQRDLKKAWWIQPYGDLVILMLSYFAYMVDGNHQSSIYLLMIMGISFFFYQRQHRQTKRQVLNYTPRCLRLIAMLYGCLMLVLFVMAHFCTLEIIIGCTPLFYYLPYLILPLANKFIEPIEENIARYYYDAAKEKRASHHHLHVIGVSGSAGKTSVKNILVHCLKDDYYVLSTPYSYNTAMGISKTINQQLNHLHEYFVCECGIDHINEMDDIASLIEPNDVILTPILNQHLETMKTHEHILQEKFKLAHALSEDGMLVVYGDDQNMRLASEQLTCQVIYYGANPDNDYRYDKVEISEKGTSFQIMHQGQAYLFETILYGEHAVMNICAVLALLHEKGYPFEHLQQHIKSLNYTPHRLEKKVMKDYILLDDAYNANPKGAHFALEVLAKMPGKHIIVTSGFVELGSDWMTAQAALGIQASSCCDEIILIGERQCAVLMDAILATGYDFRHIHLCQNMSEALTLASMLATDQTYVLIENDLPDHYLS